MSTPVDHPPDISPVSSVPAGSVGEGAPPENPFRFGSRYLRHTLPDGREVVREVPLTQRDLLYPQEGDEYPMRPAHMEDMAYLHQALEGRLAGAGVVVLGDCQLNFGVPGVQELRPDIAILHDVHSWAREGTFRIPKEGGRIVCLIEITSQDTRAYDLDDKLKLYYQAGVECYVLVDRGPSGKAPPRVLGFVRGVQDWEAMPVSAAGRVRLPESSLELGAEDGQAVLYDLTTGEALPRRAELEGQLAGARQEAAEARHAADELAQKLAAESQERARLEARVRDLEAGGRAS